MGITILLFSNVKQYFKSDYTPAALTRKRPHLYHSPFMANSDVASNSRNTMKWLIRHCIEPTHNCVHAYKVRSRPFTNVNQKPWLECQIFCYSTNCQLEAGTASFYWKFRNGFFLFGSFIEFIWWTIVSSYLPPLIPCHLFRQYALLKSIIANVCGQKWEWLLFVRSLLILFFFCCQELLWTVFYYYRWCYDFA